MRKKYTPQGRAEGKKGENYLCCDKEEKRLEKQLRVDASRVLKTWPTFSANIEKNDPADIEAGLARLGGSRGGRKIFAQKTGYRTGGVYNRPFLSPVGGGEEQHKGALRLPRGERPTQAY